MISFPEYEGFPGHVAGISKWIPSLHIPFEIRDVEVKYILQFSIYAIMNLFTMGVTLLL